MTGVAMVVLVCAAALVVGVAGGLARRGSAGRRTAPARAAAAPTAPARTLSITCKSPALGGTLPAQVFLPAGYRAHGKRYPVVYFLHGLPAGPTSYTKNAFVAQSLVAAHQQAIVVAPQGAQNDNDDLEYLDWSETEDWPRAISHDLTACIDHRFDAIADRTGRALVGLSAGGYGAANIGLRNLKAFGAVESWSGYFVATDPSGDHALQLPTPAAQRAATVPDGSGLAEQLARWPTFVGFYVGTADQRFLAMNEAFDKALRKAGVAHVFRTYPGGHSAALWSSEAPNWLGMALGYLAAHRLAPERVAGR
ncbi:MAG TPA: alpha/beta hydrolase-fold protein [Solirubrobacteraceae bacterium]|nr:alpha/beta hydrolase-fold protein [Solirubrobacteraceae bacterium]